MSTEGVKLSYKLNNNNHIYYITYMVKKQENTERKLIKSLDKSINLPTSY